MQTFAIFGLAAALAAGTALAAAPSSAEPVRGHVVVGTHGARVGIHTRGFHGRFGFHRFHPGRITVVERDRWRHGHWWHGRRHGRLGWWWFTGGSWYWYPQAVYPYPGYVSEYMAYDYAPQGYSDNSWYYCEDPQGYYPYIQQCNGDWRPVPISPQARSESAYGMPPGDQDEYNGGDEDDNGAYNDGDDGAYGGGDEDNGAYDNDNDSDNSSDMDDDDQGDDDSGNGY